MNSLLLEFTLIRLVGDISVCYRDNLRKNCQINVIDTTRNWMQMLDIIIDSYSDFECSVRVCCEIAILYNIVHPGQKYVKGAVRVHVT